MFEKVVTILFVKYHHVGKCIFCGSHDSLYRFEFNSVDFFYLCEIHASLFLTQSIEGIFKLNPELVHVGLSVESFKELIQSAMDKLKNYKAYSANDLFEELNKNLGEK